MSVLIYNNTGNNCGLLFQKLGIEYTPDDDENELNSDEFLIATKKLLRKKFDGLK